MTTRTASLKLEERLAMAAMKRTDWRRRMMEDVGFGMEMIYGIKTLVKSYLPVKDAHVHSSIDGLLDILKNMLTYGEISSEIHSSLVDKAHLRLASAKAVLRLSRQWDHKIPIGLFYWTLETSKVKAIDEEMRTGFLGIGFRPKWGLKDIPIMPKVFLCLLSILQDFELA
ncbi:hypothetical protein K1719_026710 [Acacia pycnantha]|nr:hypothetical protein K1719_026710 [Acacia pycnantha]